MKPATTKKFVLVTFAAIVALLALCPETFAQCPMCRTAVTNSGAKAMNLGILVLLIPPVSMFCSVFVIAYRYRKARADDGGTTGDRHRSGLR